MSEQEQEREPPMVPTTMRQRLDWRPVEGAAFPQLREFVLLLQVYSLATGKRYDKIKVEDPQKHQLYRCRTCDEGYVLLRIERRNAHMYWWEVETVFTCDCGSPSGVVQYLREDGASALMGRTSLRTEDWELLASACFPCGFVRNRNSLRDWDIRCQRKNCPGRMQIELQYVQGGTKYERLHVTSVVDCGCNDRSCPICTQDEFQEWIEFPCGKRTCSTCLQQLVQSCPPAILTNPCLVVFDPDRNASHCYNCPFCKTPYVPKTELTQHRVQGRGVISRKVPLYQLVEIPYAYQSFDSHLPAHIPNATQYEAVRTRYTAYWNSVANERLRETAVVPEPAPTSARVRRSASSWALDWLDCALHEVNTQLRFLRQNNSLLFEHQHAPSNFISAIEHLHQQGRDVGFLPRVAGLRDDNARYNFIQNAYRTGWEGEGNVPPSLVLDLFRRNGLIGQLDVVENWVVDLVSDSDDDSDAGDASD